MTGRSRSGGTRAAIAVAIGVVAFLGVLGAVHERDRVANDRFDLVRWEITRFPGKWLHAIGAPFRDDLPPDEAIRRYFALTDRDSSEARALQKSVESAIEGRLNAVLSDMGVSARVKLPGSVFPPPDLELAEAPRVLVESPRTVIERRHVELLKPGLTLDEALAIERDRERQPNTSALVVGSGGVATYPSVVSNQASYVSTVTTAAHEWTHQYLAFYPLGRRYFEGGDLNVINETVADIVGEEVGAEILRRWGDPTAPPQPAGPPASTVDRDQVLRSLRLEVDALLAAGRVDEAERRMDEVRRQLQDDGIFIRRINQAYFAWYGTYAARPDATDPLGPMLRGIRDQSESLQQFLARIRGLTSRGGVERLAEGLGVAVPPAGS